MKGYNPSVIKDYNPSDSQETSVYEINRRGVLGLFVTSAGAMALTACGGKKETTSEQTSGQLSEHVDSSDDTSSSEKSPTPEGPKKLEASEFQTMESLYKHFFDSRIPEGRKAFEALTIPANDYNDPQKLGQHFSNIFEKICNVFTDTNEQSYPPVSEYYEVQSLNRLGQPTTKRGAIKLGDGLVSYFAENYLKGTVFEDPGVDMDGKPKSLDLGNGLTTFLTQLVSSEAYLQKDDNAERRENEWGTALPSFTSPAEPDKFLGKISIEEMSVDNAQYSNETVDMKFSCRPDTEAEDSETITSLVDKVGNNNIGGLDRILGLSIKGIKDGHISFKKTNEGTAVISSVSFNPHQASYKEIQEEKQS